MSPSGAAGYFKRQTEAIRRHPLLWLFFFVLGAASAAAFLKSSDGPESGARMGYRDLSNAKLSEKALMMVAELRELATDITRADERISVECEKREDEARTDSRKSEVRRKCNDEIARSLQNFLSRYEESYKADVLILREEMLHRLPEAREKSGAPILYSYPGNALGLGEVATGLEVLAKLLPRKAGTTSV